MSSNEPRNEPRDEQNVERSNDEPTGLPADDVPAATEPAPAEPAATEPAATTSGIHRPKSTGLATGEAAPGVPKKDPILVIDGVTRRFGGLNAVDVEHLEIPRGAITALIGPNGAGKTTLFNLLCGFDRPNSGNWSYDGRQLAGVPSFKVARMGQVRTFQLTKALSLLTVLENMKLGARDQTGERFWTSLLPFVWRGREREIEQKARELLARFKLDTKEKDFAASLSGGQRKLLEMARALMCDPQLVMLDEPMAGVNPALTQSLLGHILELKDAGTTVLFVEHDMHMVRHIADWVVVMAEGRVVAEGPPDEVMTDPAVVDAYLGSHQDVDLGVVTGRIEGELNTSAINLLEEIEEVREESAEGGDATAGADARDEASDTGPEASGTDAKGGRS